MSSARHMSPAEAAVMDALLPERLAGSSRELAQCLFEALVLADERAGCAAPAGDWAAQLQAWARLGVIPAFDVFLRRAPGTEDGWVEFYVERSDHAASRSASA